MCGWEGVCELNTIDDQYARVQEKIVELEKKVLSLTNELKDLTNSYAEVDIENMELAQEIERLTKK